MCGIVGFLDPRESLCEADAKVRLHVMAKALRHRGPDGKGVWAAAGAGSGVAVGLGHRRLSIVDLSAAGAQPMQSRCGRYVMVFNGEVFNFAELREALEARQGGFSWRGHSDSEVLLEWISAVGVENAVARVDGMFALAVYDRETRSLTLLRDPFGEKPLYYGLWEGTLLFASELQALETWPGFAPKESPQALVDYLKYSYVPAPATIYEGVYKLPAAHRVVLSAERLLSVGLPPSECYWDMVGTALSAGEQGFRGTCAEAVAAVEAALTRSAKRRRVADVPVGALLSGGIDSSLVASLLQQGADAPLRTFTIGMDEPGYDEAQHARQVAAHLGTEHTALVLTPAEVQAMIPEIASIYGEPFADASQVPTYLVSRLAREHVTVALSGDGGDELFGGYNRHFHGARLWRWLQRMPYSTRQAAARWLHRISPQTLERAMQLGGRWTPAELRTGRAGEKLHKLAGLLSAADLGDFHDRLLTTGASAALAVMEAPDPTPLAGLGDPRASGLSFAAQAMLLDTAHYLPNDVLTKVDRASMAVSLEVRTPFLSRELFELAWQLPMEMKVASGQGKLVLRELLYRHVPRQLVDRPKAGFAVPVGRWLRGPLRDWAESLLSSHAVAATGVFRAPVVRRLWEEHVTGRRDHETFLWSVLVYQGWRARRI